MPITHSFDYQKPGTLREALALLARKNAVALAGGTDLIGYLKEELVSPELLVDLKGLKELKRIEHRGGALHIGALVTFAEVIDSKVIGKKLPVLAEISKKVASVGIRNRATLVGNLCSAVPCLDTGPILVAMDALVLVKGKRGSRKIPAEKWFIAPRKTARKPGELVTGISIPLPRGKAAACYLKLGRYRGEDLAQASVFVSIEQSSRGAKARNFRVAFGSVGPVPCRARKIEKALAAGGALIDMVALKKLVPAEISPITDIRASKEYRLHMCQVMLERALAAADGRLNGTGPAYGASLL